MAVHPKGVDIMKPGGLVKDPISALSLGLGATESVRWVHRNIFLQTFTHWNHSDLYIIIPQVLVRVKAGTVLVDIADLHGVADLLQVF